jgi:hypothetical protein
MIPGVEARIGEALGPQTHSHNRTLDVWEVMSRRYALIVMMLAANFRPLPDRSQSRRLHRSWLRRIHLQRLVSPPSVIVVQVRPEDPVQMSLIQHDHMIERVPSNAADDPVRSKNSCGLAVVVLEEPPEPLSAFYRPFRTSMGLG